MILIDRNRHAIQYGGTTILYRIKLLTDLSDRVRIHIDPDANIIVEAPGDCDGETVRKILRARARWICEQLREISMRKANILVREYVSGESHLYLGRRYMLKVLAADSNNPPVVKLTGSFLKVWIDKNTECPQNKSVRHLLRIWYRHHAHEYIARRLVAMQSSVSWMKHLPDWRLLTMKRQWGSCSPSRVILINPSLIKAPASCVDYILLHEICHLKEHNHSQKFYRLLDRIFPTWEKAKHQLDRMAENILRE